MKVGGVHNPIQSINKFATWHRNECPGQLGMAAATAVVGGVRCCPPKLKSSSSHRTTINASFFWEPNPKRNTYSSSSHHQQFTFPLTTQSSSSSPNTITISFVSSISQISSTQWDACALDATGHHNYNPFLSHAFLSTLEHSHSAVKEKGWTPHHIIAQDQSNQILAVVPLYLKTHSYGEFVFDHSWANAYYNYGSSYYPKLQSCVPFTPVTGPRILLRDTSIKNHVFDFILSAIKDLTAMSHLSSFHVTFPSENEWHKFTQKGFLPRIGMQYHWTNRNYKK